MDVPTYLPSQISLCFFELFTLNVLRVLRKHKATSDEKMLLAGLLAKFVKNAYQIAKATCYR